MVKVYEYAKCSTCKKALSFLKKNDVAFTAVAIAETPPSKAELKRMLRHVGNLKRLFNTSGQLYRELKLSERLPGMTEEQALELLSKNGKLVKRPFLLAGAAG